MRYTQNWFPEALSKKEQDELCRTLPDKQAKDTLVLRNMRLVVYIAKKYSKSNEDEIENFISIGTIGLLKAANTFDYKKNIKFATYASRCIENEILMSLRKETRHKSEVSLETILAKDDQGNELLIEDIYEDKKSRKDMEAYENYEDVFMILNDVSNKLYRKSSKDLILFMYMICGKRQREVAELCEISQSYISRLFRKYKKICEQVSKGCYNSKNESDFLHFYKDEESLYLEIRGYPTIKTALEVESFEKIADFLAFTLM